VRVGLDWQQSSEEASLTPAVVCTDIVERLSDSLSGAEATTETVSEIVTKHYALDDADLERLPELLGTSPETQLPDKFQVDVWVADEGRWPVRLNITSQTTDEQGRAIGLDLFMEFRDVGDPGIAIDAPLVSASDG